ncbi:MAG TPA: GNAT family protein [Planococcus sp. (in: firmicutes)]|nr:GNAT family protein [Planococcus sp. (in: firmicutes)]
MFIHKIDNELSLKLVELGDTQRIFELTEGSRSYLKEWLPWLDFTTELKDTEDFIKASRGNYAEGKTLNAAILFNGEIVGLGGFNNINPANKTAYIGYWLGQEYQGKGIMTRVARALTDYALNDLKLNKVEIRAAAGNVKSRSIPERLGYVEEGTIRRAESLYGHFVDHVVYGMLAEEWDKK